MKRVGNKSGQLVRSASRRGKATSRFQFDITIQKVTGVKPGATYLVKWTRGVKVAQTKNYTVPKQSSGKAGLAVEEKISLLVTLFRDDKGKFDAKDSKLSLISVTPKNQERTIAKLHFDLTHFAGVPHASVPKNFRLNEKVSIQAVVESRFLKAGPSGSGSAGASSALSGVSARSSDDEIEDDFDDLALDDIPEADSLPMNKPTSAVSSKRISSSKVPLVVETPRSAASLNAERNKPPPSTPLSSSTVTSSESPPPARSARIRPPRATSDDVNVFAKPATGNQHSYLKKENEKLSSDLKRYKAEKSTIEESHRRQVEELRSKLEESTKVRSAFEAERISTDSSVANLRKKNVELENKASGLQRELGTTKRQAEDLSARCKKLEATERKCTELSREVDRLAIAAAGPPNTSSNDTRSSEVEKRIEILRREKEALEKKIRAHEVHASKTKAAYQKLTDMYNSIRGQHVALTKELEELKTERAASAQPVPSSAADGQGDVQPQLEGARQEIRDIQASKDSLQSDYDRLLYQTDSVQDRLERVGQELEDARKENDILHAETEELKGQRDMAMHRALSKGKSTSSNSDSTRSIGRVEEELRLTRDKLEREHTRLTRRSGELETEIRDLKEDIDFEKSEKSKAREERDKFRESARALERRTSLAAKQSDAMHSMRRQLSTHQMRQQDHESTVTDLRSEIARLCRELEEAKKGDELSSFDSRDNIGDVLQDLVGTKLALAQAEDEKLNLQFTMKTMKKSEKAIQERLAAHASRLEVKLGHANEEVDKLRKNQGLADATEFNDLGSDVDY